MFDHFDTFSLASRTCQLLLFLMYAAPLLHRIWIYAENQQFRGHFCLVLCCMTLSISLCTFLHFHSFPQLYPKHKYEAYDTKVEKVPVILRADTASLLYQFFPLSGSSTGLCFLPDATYSFVLCRTESQQMSRQGHSHGAFSSKVFASGSSEHPDEEQEL